jgi:hypothetical protein
MELNVDIDEELLREFDRAVRVHNITRDTAVRGAITAWLSQARRDAALRELFDTEFDPECTASARHDCRLSGAFLPCRRKESVNPLRLSPTTP